METVVKTILDITSPAFDNNNYIPEKYTCEGSGINPPLTIHKIPDNAKSLALIMDDPDAPGSDFTHWIMWNIPPREGIEENSAPGVVGINGNRENKYFGPCPPGGIHRYYFRFYALDAMLDLQENTTKNALQEAMQNHILASGELIGLYKLSAKKGKKN